MEIAEIIQHTVCYSDGSTDRLTYDIKAQEDENGGNLFIKATLNGESTTVFCTDCETNTRLTSSALEANYLERGDTSPYSDMGANHTILGLELQVDQDGHLEIFDTDYAKVDGCSQYDGILDVRVVVNT